MICKVIETIEKNELLKSVKTVAVGVSGGADSMCLLHILSSLKVKYGIIIKAVHLNHNLRGNEALRDQKLVEKYCNDNNIELLLFSEDISSLAETMHIGQEECGRLVRYKCFEKAGCDAVAVAHSLSDSIETVIYNLLRGTGLKGLCGIPVKREPNIIRPLINCTRNEIENYCRYNNVPYVVDSTNLKDDYKRNFIRNNIIPLFGNINECYDRNISHAISVLKEENSFIESCASELAEKSRNENGYCLDRFQSAHSAVRKRAIGIILSEKMNKPVEFRHIKSVNNIIESGNGKAEISKNLYITVNENLISFTNKIENVGYWERSFENSLAETDYGIYELVHGDFTAERENAFDSDKVIGKLVLTSRREGDVFTFKKRGVSKSLKKLFNEMKIPSDERGKIAVLRDENEIIWVEGVGVNAPYIPVDEKNNIFIIKKEG